MTQHTARRRGSGTIWMILGLMAMVALGAGLWLALGPGWSEAKPSLDGITAAVSQGEFIHTVAERGEVESGSNVEIRCEVKSKGNATTLKWIIEEGKMVQPGDKVLEFDASILKEQETQQQITYEQARAAMIQAELAFESAKIAVEEYVNGTFEQELKTIESEMVVAEENLRRAQDHVEYSRKLARKGYVTDVQLEADQFAVTNAQISLETAQLKKRVLRDYTRAKMLKQLQSDVGTAEAQMLAQKASFSLEEQRLEEIRDQITKCVVTSPAAGQVVYANETDRRGNVEEFIKEGMTVREQQVLIRLPDPESMRVRANVKEGRIALVRPGQPVKIEVKGFPGGPLWGRVGKINPIAITQWGSSVKEYATYIEIDEPPAGLKPGMTASVEIIVNQQPDSLMVPVQSVAQRNGKHYVCLKGVDGPEALPVKLGATNDKFAIILEGLKADQEVALNPDVWLADLLPEEVRTETVGGPQRGQMPRGQRPGPGGASQGRPEGAGRPAAAGRSPGGRPGGGETAAAQDRAAEEQTPGATSSETNAQGDAVAQGQVGTEDSARSVSGGGGQ